LSMQEQIKRRGCLRTSSVVWWPKIHEATFEGKNTIH